MNGAVIDRDVVNTLRGLACIFLVFFHAVGANQDLGLQLSEGFLREFNDFLAYYRMPLFTFLSGLVYGLRPFSGGWLKFFKGKFRRLMLPLLFLGTIFAFLQMIMKGGDISDLAWIHVYPVAHFWFIESLFWIFLLMAVIDGLKLGVNAFMFAFFYVLSLAAFMYLPRLDVFSFSGTVYLFPFFLLGLGVVRFSLVWYVRLINVVAVFISLFGVSYYLVSRDLISDPRNGADSLILGSLACVFLLHSRLSIRLLALMGSYSYAIYLYHVFFMAPARMVMEKFFLLSLNEYTLFLSAIILALFGLIGPCFLERIVLYMFPRFSPILLGVKSPRTSK